MRSIIMLFTKSLSAVHVLAMVTHNAVFQLKASPFQIDRIWYVRSACKCSQKF